MNTLVKIGTIGFGLFAFSELCGIIGEAQAFSAMIEAGKCDAKELYALFDELINDAEGYTKFKIKMTKVFTSVVMEYYG